MVISVGIGGLLSWLIKRPEQRTTIERARFEKEESERKLAKDLRDESIDEARNVRQETREYITNLLAQLRYEIEIAATKSSAAGEKSELKLEQLAKAFYEYKNDQNRINEKVVKSIEFIHTVLLGPGAKSLPPYMLGQDETQAHKDKPDVGAFEGDEDDK